MFNNMGKSTHFTGQPVYNQAIKLIDKQKIRQISFEKPRSVPMVVQLTSAATHDHYLLKEVHLPKDATLTMGRTYGDYA